MKKDWDETKIEWSDERKADLRWKVETRGGGAFILSGKRRIRRRKSRSWRKWRRKRKKKRSGHL